MPATSPFHAALPPVAQERSVPVGWAPYPRLLAALVVVLLAVSGLGSTATSAQAAAPDGTVVAWGDDTDGRSSVPDSLSGETVVAVAAGFHHSLALTSEGQVTAWGSDALGQASVPPAPEGTRYTAIAAGGNHSLALTSDGQVTAWGSSIQGQVSVPAAPEGTRYTAIAAGGYHSLALTSDGQVTGWGNDLFGQSTAPDTLPEQEVTAISAGDFSSLALTADGEVTGWGDDDAGQSTVPVALAEKTVTAIAAGGYHSLALTADGQVTGWGDNGHGQSTVPPAPVGTQYTAVAAGYDHGLALTSAGAVVGWGYAQDGQTSVPPAAAGRGYTAIAAGFAHSLGIVATREEASALVVRAPLGLTLARQRARITARGLVAGESWTIRVGGKPVAAGRATSTGTLDRRVMLPARARDGRAVITVTGESGRTGRTTARVLTRKTLGSRTTKRSVAVAHLQRVIITGLAGRERVTLTYRGKRVSARNARASAEGVYRLRFRVGKQRGLKTVKAVGEFRSRHATTTFRVTRR